MRWSPQALAEAAKGRLLARGSREISSAFIDSRAPIAGGLFVPIVAARDGHDFIPAAIEGGAAAVLQHPGHPVVDSDVTVVEVDDTQAAFDRLAAHARGRVSGPVIAITGSNGKTTTRAMIEAVVGSALPTVLATQGNLNNHLGVPLTLLGEPHDPDAMVVELGMSAPGENDALARIVSPTVSVITSVAIEHLEFMGSIEAIAAAEAEVVPHVRPGGAVVVPGDEVLLEPHLPGPDGPRVYRCGPGAGDVVIRSVRNGAPTVATLEVQGRTVDVPLQVFGAHNARNAAAAIAVGTHLGFDLDGMVAALASVQPVGDRGRVLAFGPHMLIADCYNANPGSMEVALDALAGLRTERPGPLVVVFGDMLELGLEEKRFHREVGERFAELGLDALVGTGPLAAEAVDAAKAEGRQAVYEPGGPDKVAEWIRARMGGQPPGAILLKGSRGMRLERVCQALLDESPG